MKFLIFLCTLVVGFLGYGSLVCYYTTKPVPSASAVFAVFGVIVFVIVFFQILFYKSYFKKANTNSGFHPWWLFFTTLGVCLSVIVAGYNIYNNVSPGGMGIFIPCFSIINGIIIWSMQANFFPKKDVSRK